MFTRLIKMEDKVRTKFDVNTQYSCFGKRQSRLQHSTLRFAHNSTSALPTIQHSTLYFPIRLTARAKRYCGGEPLIQLLLDDVAKERCREWIEEICNS